MTPEEKKAPEAEVPTETVEEPKEESKKAEKPKKSSAKAAEEAPATADTADKKKTEPSAKVAKILEQIESMTVLELADMVKVMEERFGVSAAAPAAVMAAPAQAGAAAAEEEQTMFDVILESFGDKKIQVIKAARAITSLGLKEAKDLVESAPKPIKEGVSKEDADKAKKTLEEAGGTVSIK